MSRLAYIMRRRNLHIEPVWHVRLALLAAIALQFVSAGPGGASAIKYIVAGVEVLLLVLLMVVAYAGKTQFIRETLGYLLTALVSIVNMVLLAMVISSLFGSGALDGKHLLLSAFSIYLTNIIIFGLWYWELDYQDGSRPRDFLFPQGKGDKDHPPSFFDYLYVSITNSTAFSPTDTMPLTHRAKLLMSVQSIISLVVVVLVTARAVNMLA